MTVKQTTDEKRSLDDPLSDPTGDLLDMNHHALALANYIRSQESKLPFTVGIFGEWGEGKTTMVNFLERHLRNLNKAESKPAIKFISFSAWPFTTSEKLWRALIIKIAQDLCDYDPEKAPKKTPAPEDGGWLNKLSQFLVSDFFSQEPAEPPTDYERFVKDLEDTDFGRISKRTPSDQANHEAIVAAVVNGALTVLGSMSPLVSGLRSLLGLEPKIDVQQLTQAQTEESSTGTLEPLQRFRNILDDMLKATAKGQTVYVFIDDLDRAQPDVALDIMESIRIACSNVDCVFIIAVDETLISQGLQLRYKDLFAGDRKVALANKGQDYLEKIIQFRTRVPTRTDEQTKRLIAAEFPDWNPAGDIISTIANNNPRRIKQYCHRLSFQKGVGSSFMLGSASEETPLAPTLTSNEPTSPPD